MSISIPDILIRPEAFFDNALAEKENLTVPALIILLGSIVAAIYGYLMGGLSAKMMAGMMPGMDSIILISAVAGAFVGTFIFWIIVAAVFYLISLAFKGQGSFSRVMEVVGYGYLPQVLGSLITLIAAIEYLPKVTVPILTKSALDNPEAIEAAMKTFMHDPAMVELTQITTLVAIVFMLWSAHIWIFGIKKARNISMRDSAICVGIPIVLYVLYLIHNLGAL
ncbi:MAG: YIP1 family protein [Methanomicrobiales archaeon]|nr:YIP1 family protein [Methanomicrobiales archaeon]